LNEAARKFMQAKAEIKRLQQAAADNWTPVEALASDYRSPAGCSAAAGATAPSQTLQ
jgi:hypothetical protein